MNLTEREILTRLGQGEPIAAVCQAAGLSRNEFDAWWKEACRRRAPAAQGTIEAGVSARVEIDRDGRGIPHIYAESEEDLLFGFGFAMAQDRLFQLDYLRRKASGRLAEILGPESLAQDVLVRTVGLRRIAEAEWHRLPEQTQTLLTAFTAGVNAVIDASGDALPVEFDLLDYRPEAWSPIDSLAIESEFRWYLTGRFPVIVMPELAKRTLGDGGLFREFLVGEADDECILPPEYYPPGTGQPEAVGQAIGDPDGAIGSNNWAVARELAAGGGAMIAGDPHIAVEAVSCWYLAHLSGGAINVSGMAYVGMPAIMAGRNEQVAWAITNNICSQRDLYQEKTSDEHPGCFLYDGAWEPERTLEEMIEVRGGEPVAKTIRFSRNGPIVDEILPSPGNETGPVALKWLGAYQGGWLTAMLAMNRAGDVESFRAALRSWHVPTFCLVFADNTGRIAYQATGRIPVRRHPERGYRPGWDPEHQWQGLIPFESMPGVIDPARGWMATANNRVATGDYPYPLSGTWSSGCRARRIRQMIEQRSRFTREDFSQMQYDTLSLRAVEGVPGLLAAIRAGGDERAQAAGEILSSWDGHVRAEGVAPTIFNVFFSHWVRQVALERFDSQAAALLAKGCEPIAARLLHADRCQWFAAEDRQAKMLAALDAALDMLTDRFGSDISVWTWGKLHRMPLLHVLGSRGDLGELLNHGGDGVDGDVMCVGNTGQGDDWEASTGGGYRMIVDLAHQPPGMWAIDAPGQSGHPGSPHYDDQFAAWTSGDYHFLSLGRDAHSAQRAWSLEPRS